MGTHFDQGADGSEAARHAASDAAQFDLGDTNQARTVEISRVLNLGLDLTMDLARVAAGSLEDSDRQADVMDRIPTELTAEEVRQLGLQITVFVEAVNPSWDAIKHGHRAEKKTLTWLAFRSVENGDFKTAESVSEHLRSQGGLRKRFASFVINKSLKRAQSSE